MTAAAYRWRAGRMRRIHAGSVVPVIGASAAEWSAAGDVLLAELRAQAQQATRTVCLDFDGTLTQSVPYKPGLATAPPAAGMRAVLEQLHQAGYTLVVLTARPPSEVHSWLVRNGIYDLIDSVTNTKPPAIAYVDDRSVKVDPTWKTVLQQIAALERKPYRPQVGNDAEVQAAGDATDPRPTPAQAVAGNYRKRDVRLHGLPISVETERGGVRHSKPDAPVPWSRQLAHTYGYIRGTVGKDKDHVDCFIAPHAAACDQATIINQLKDDGTFDEHKVMLGWPTQQQALDAYAANYPTGWAKTHVGTVRTVPVAWLKLWLAHGNQQLQAAEAREAEDLWGEAGSKVSGYSSHGPFRCADCVHQTDGWCRHPVVYVDPVLEHRASDRTSHVQPDDCCKFQRGTDDLAAMGQDAVDLAAAQTSPVAVSQETRRCVRCTGAAERMRPPDNPQLWRCTVCGKVQPPSPADTDYHLPTQQAEAGTIRCRRCGAEAELDPPDFAEWRCRRCGATFRDPGALGAAALQAEPQPQFSVGPCPRCGSRDTANAQCKSCGLNFHAASGGELRADYNPELHPHGEHGLFVPTGGAPHPQPVDRPAPQQAPAPSSPAHPMPHPAAVPSSAPAAPPAALPAPKPPSLPATIARSTLDPPPPPLEPAKAGDPPARVARVGVPADQVPPPPPVPRLPNLNEAERRAEGNFTKWYEDDPDRAVKELIAGMQARTIGDGPNMFSTDEAKLLSTDYNPKVGEHGVTPQDNLDSRALYNTAVHQTADALAKRAFLSYLDTVVAKDPDPERHSVFATVGGCAAGKGYCLQRATGEIAKRLTTVGAVWDSAGEANSTELGWVQAECEKRGLHLTVAYINNDGIDRWNSEQGGAIMRAQGHGRMVNARVYADSYALGARNYMAWSNLPSVKNNPHIENIMFDARSAVPAEEGPPPPPPMRIAKLPAQALHVDEEHLYNYCLTHTDDDERATAAIRAQVHSAARIWGPPHAHYTMKNR